MSIDALREDFAVLEDWEDRYRYIIDLGRQLPALPESERTEANKVRGCASQVWVATTIDRSNPSTPRLTFTGDSDALIVRGLIAVLFALYDGRLATEIVATNAEQVFADLGLKEHLTQQRSNGLASMVQRIRRDAAASLDQGASPPTG